MSRVFLTVNDVAERWRVSPWTIREMARCGRVPCRKMGAGRSPILFDERELERFEDEPVELETVVTPAGGRITRERRR